MSIRDTILRMAVERTVKVPEHFLDGYLKASKFTEKRSYFPHSQEAKRQAKRECFKFILKARPICDFTESFRFSLQFRGGMDFWLSRDRNEAGFLQDPLPGYGDHHALDALARTFPKLALKLVNDEFVFVPAREEQDEARS